MKLNIKNTLIENLPADDNLENSRRQVTEAVFSYVNPKKTKAPKVIHASQEMADLLGISKDGRKRALSLLLSFFTSLEFPADYIKEIISTWNAKNYAPLKEGYIRSKLHIAAKRK